MIRFTLAIPEELNDWLEAQAKTNERSKHKHIRYILNRAMRDASPSRYTLNSPKLCNNGQHHFKQAEPAMSDFCNCQMFCFGEVAR